MGTKKYLIDANYIIHYNYAHEGTSEAIEGFETIEEAKKRILELQLLPNSFYNNEKFYHIDRLAPHYVTIDDAKTGKVVVGGEKDIKITTLGVLSAENAMNIPDGHIYLFNGGSETKHNFADSLKSRFGIDTEEEDIIFHIDKREFDNMANAIFTAETGYEYSRVKAQKLKFIMESRFYNSLRDGLEDGLTGRLSEVIISELGSAYTDDTMFEDTQRHLLSYAIQEFHRDTTAKLSFIQHQSKEAVLIASRELDVTCETIEGDPPKFFTDEWAIAMKNSISKIMNHVEECEMTLEPIRYTAPKKNEVAQAKKKIEQENKGAIKR